MKKLLLVISAILVYAPVYAQTGACPDNTSQTVINATWICIGASPDHAATKPVTNEPVVSRYDVLFFAPGVDPVSGNPVTTINVGKGTPNAQNAIWLQRAELSAIPVGQLYRANTVAVGPDGTSPRSASPSGPFAQVAPVVPRAPARTSVTAAP